MPERGGGNGRKWWKIESEKGGWVSQGKTEKKARLARRKKQKGWGESEEVQRREDPGKRWKTLHLGENLDSLRKQSVYER